MNTLYLRSPSSAALHTTAIDPALRCLFALATQQGALARSGEATLADLAPAIAAAERVVLLPAAAEVALLAVTPPPMSAGRLRLALPGLVEEHLLDDPVDCVLVSAAPQDEVLPIAAMRRDRLQALAGTCVALGARKLQAWPLQSCLPADRCIVALQEYAHADGVFLELALRVDTHTPLGMTLHAPDAAGAVAAVLAAVRLLAPQRALTLMVPAARVDAYRSSTETGIDVQADDWQMWIDGARRNPFPDLAAALPAARGKGLQAWKRPLQLAAALLLLNIAALNIDWWRLQREAGALQADMRRTYGNAFPQDRVILDPLLQMQQKIADAQRVSGQAGPDDFLMLAADFGAAWRGLPASDASIATLEYRDRGLLVRTRQASVQLREQLRGALAARRLALAQDGADAWQIRRAP